MELRPEKSRRRRWNHVLLLREQSRFRPLQVYDRKRLLKLPHFSMSQQGFSFGRHVLIGMVYFLDGQKHLLGTWAEINWHANGSRNAWGDISLLQGNDGAAMIQSLDGLVREKGFTTDLVSNAPANLLAQKGTGSWCLDKIIGPGANNATREWERQFLDPRNVYLEDDIDPVINSENGRFQVTFFEGII
ncbi:hypothetical protein K445DRAFT_321896 [Daldinia sp. EC12]|nr:hypothetical protein F4774DRAFT_401817 [Daldinia eschscholtzii]OTB11507.1 hypothetical protein K445DRAFT_321896 [Daldinia sp. EC12]